MTADRLHRLPSILSLLEDLELPLLSWGVTDVGLTSDEVGSILTDSVMADLAAGVTDGPDEPEYLSALQARGLLHRLPASSPPLYRTRLAEGMRLLSGLRQLFPPSGNAPADWWQGGAPLVADYRLNVGPRRYPARNLSPQDVVGRLSRSGRWSAEHTKIAEAMIDGRDLSEFQVAATEAILSAVADPRARGVVVGAGTGSGKTLAFYLPALLTLGPSLQSGRQHVDVLALYPRTELLRDQAREGIAATLRTGPTLKANGLRIPRIGLLYGDTPRRARDWRFGKDSTSWKPIRDGALCPYFPCPVEDCGGDLVWRTSDRNVGIERLYCLSCRLELGDDVIALTRDAMFSRPVDILFSTTEMLSRSSSDRREGGLLGWTGPTAPRLVLLDEVHTYAGVHGAQVALMLRRWRGALRGRRMPTPTFVGLSATLRDAVPFFATFTGLHEAAVEYVSPAEQDMEPVGREYSVVLRGDPVSGTSLLSTTLQTAMLMGRLLNRRGGDGTFGSSGFLFTDDLDVTNRLYDDLRDAEGGQSRRARPGPSRRPVLAQLRSPQFTAGGSARMLDRYRDAQLWTLCTEVGHPLTGTLTEGALRVGRTTSQDTGVDAIADLIVATSSLEVGFNDHRVGMVLQHKAPRDPAAFIQRRGRAGRSPRMRPWTVVVLSDYGRDRIAYQTYEQLLYPEVPAKRLPVRNRFVLKMQAAHCLLDWLSREASRGNDRWIDAREVLKAPASPGPVTGGERVLRVLTDLLTSPERQDDFTAFLERALDVPMTEAQALLWEEPRSLLLAVAPTAARRLTAEWRTVDGPESSRAELLPEFLTRTLFHPLDVPDVELHLPFESDVDNRMAVLSALRETAPGRVSQRFGVRRDEDRTWIEPPPGPVIELSTVVRRGRRLGTWSADGRDFDVVQPIELALVSPGPEINDSSNAMPTWHSGFVLSPEAIDAPLPQDGRWPELVADARFALHVIGTSAEVRRMTSGSAGETLRRDGSRNRVRTHYAIDGSDAALGFSLSVDGFSVHVRPLNRSDPAVVAHLRSPGWRTFAFRALVEQDPALEPLTNRFQREWLTTLYLTAYGVTAADGANGDPLQRLSGGAWAADLRIMFGVLYRALDPDAAPLPSAQDRLADALQDLVALPTVHGAVERHARVLFAAEPEELSWPLAARTYADTLAAAVRAAAARALPDAQDLDLVVDVVPNDDGFRILLTETSNGGLGLMEQLHAAYARDFRRFWRLVTDALGPSDYEEVDRAVRHLLREVVINPGGAVAVGLAEVRAATGVHEADAAFTRLREAWTVLDGPPRHLTVAAVAARLLRRGSTSETATDVHRLLVAWDELETRTGVEIDARVIAYAARHLGVSLPADQVFSLLWPRGIEARNRHLLHWQPYVERLFLDRLLAYAAVRRPLPVVDVTQPDWIDRYRTTLGGADGVELRAPGGERTAFASALRRVAVIAVDRGPLRIHGRLGRVSHTAEGLAAHVSVLEAEQ